LPSFLLKKLCQARYTESVPKGVLFYVPFWWRGILNLLIYKFFRLFGNAPSVSANILCRPLSFNPSILNKPMR
ncbi:MAG: hypothetical protein RIT15_1190, partial [Pseudomonadota bacterium]